MYESEPLKIHDVEPVPLIIAQLLNTHIVISSSACLCVSPVYVRDNHTPPPPAAVSGLCVMCFDKHLY